MRESRSTYGIGQDIEVLSAPASLESPPTGTPDRFVPFREEEIEQSVPERFAQQLQRHANRIAVKSGSRVLSYDALNREANRVARAILRDRGEGNEPVALLLDNDTDMILAVLATLKAGKIYVPLEPANPVSRNSLILQDAQARLLITNDRHLALANELNQGNLRVVNLEKLDLRLANNDLQLQISPDTIACIIYTSGSTGQPKGVVVSHRNLLHRVMVLTNSFQVCAEDRLTLLQSCSYGRSIKEVFGALLNGAAVFPYDLRTDGFANLGKWLIREGITYYGSIPTTFRYFIQTLTGKEQFENIRILYLGGEPVYRLDVELYKMHFPSKCAFVHGFGATEAGTVMLRILDQNAKLDGGIVPFDQVVEGFEVLLLDESGKPAGFDSTGEFVICSPYLTLGYWRRPELTETTFRPHPAGGLARMLHTGDLGRMRPDGSLVHLGRRDFQVKIRGQRVEVAEVESALQEHDAVKEAVVSGVERHPGEKVLVAYVVPNRLPFPSEQVLRSFLLQSVPEFMVPTAYVLLDSLPLTLAGKVDRRALPPPDWSQRTTTQEYVAPRTPSEEILVGVWRELLGVEQVGVHDSFFDLGGHSLLATQVISRIRDIFHVEIPLPTIFESPTVEDLARIVEEAPKGDSGSQVHSIRALARVPRRAVESPESSPAQVANEDQVE
jgi:amino acid adenylation domain-containing protein